MDRKEIEEKVRDLMIEELEIEEDEKSNALLL